MPTPRSGETERDFMDRCVPMLINEGNDSDQAVAICASMWSRRGQSVWEQPQAVVAPDGTMHRPPQ